MADRKLECEVVTPEKILYEGQVDMVVAPGGDGELGILPLHMPIITTLQTGELRLKHGTDNQDYIAIDGGYMEIREDKVTILATAAEYASKMDVTELNHVKEEIESKLASLPEDSEEFLHATTKLKHLLNRLAVADRRK